MTYDLHKFMESYKRLPPVPSLLSWVVDPQCLNNLFVQELNLSTEKKISLKLGL